MERVFLLRILLRPNKQEWVERAQSPKKRYSGGKVLELTKIYVFQNLTIKHATITPPDSINPYMYSSSTSFSVSINRHWFLDQFLVNTNTRLLNHSLTSLLSIMTVFLMLPSSWTCSMILQAFDTFLSVSTLFNSSSHFFDAIGCRNGIGWNRDIVTFELTN